MHNKIVIIGGPKTDCSKAKEKVPQIKVVASHGTAPLPALASLVIQSKQYLHLVKK
jgi:hypothetical protein